MRNIGQAILVITLVVFSFLLLSVKFAQAGEVGYATWYSEESCLREFGPTWDGRTANMEVFNDRKLTAAHPHYRFGTLVRVSLRMDPTKYVVVRINDRGPAKYVRETRSVIIDLSKEAFTRISELKRGRAEVVVEVIE